MIEFIVLATVFMLGVVGFFKLAYKLDHDFIEELKKGSDKNERVIKCFMYN